MRVFLITVAMALLPTALYVAWLRIMRRRAEALGGQAPAFGNGPIGWVIIGWAVLMAGALVAWHMVGERYPSGTLQSPRYIDGVVVPAGPKQPERAPAAGGD